MKKILVIVESPGKIDKIQTFLNDLYGDIYIIIVKASFGHCRDLNSKELSIDVNNNYTPKYCIIDSKRRVINDLKFYKKDCSEVILAMDEDREGEMIASSLRDLLDLIKPKRIVFNEITKDAIKKAFDNPTVINEEMVFAQQTRRLLDRLVGYKLSPLLWKELKGELSAGRVQSVVVKIIIDKETEINNSISNPYFKTIADFEYCNRLSSTLMKNNKMFKFEDKKNIDMFLKQLNKKTINRVVNITNKESNKKPSPPFITSSLQQEASTKFGYPSKHTMSLAQKLYEGGYITYMRTDSTNLSQDVLNQSKKYICENYGEKYHNLRTYTKKVKGGQEAHEAIRPTNISVISDKISLGMEYKKLYSLIWKRTVASQMAYAKINIQTIYIDILKNDTSVLPENTNFVSIFEKIIFDGFLVLYNNHESDNKTGKIDIKKGVDVNFKTMKISEEYTKPPLRFNEAGLIKFLEKNGIGRPSTYASIISKIVDKNYVNIKNIEGVKKVSNIISVNKNYKISTKTKDTSIGNENKKICPTEIGIKVNDFLIEHFNNIMETNFTINLEKQLDKVACGKAKWYNILDLYYQTFNPMVLELQEKHKHIGDVNNTDELFGNHPEDNREIYKGEGKYGPYVKIMDDEKSWKFASIKDVDDLTVEKAVELLQYPKYIGKINNSRVTLNKGQYGLYFKIGTKKCSIKDETRELDLEYATQLYNTDDPFAIKTFRFDKKIVHLKKGPYGYFLKVKFTKSNKTKNISLPNNIDVEKFNISNFITK